MNTPTPGDLSARLQPLSDACLSRRLTPAECGEFHDCIAALSALPAAGGEESSRTLFGCAYQLAGYHDAPEVWLDRLSDAMQGRPLPDSDTLIDQLLPYAPDTPEKWDGHTHVASEDDGDTCEVCGRNFRAHATTPQPSAAKGTVEPFGYYIETLPPKARQSTFTRAPEIAEMEAAAAAGRVKVTSLYANAPADAAVGAQGDGDDRALIDAAIKMLRADGFVRSADAIHRLAAPAAGKGVDDAMVERACVAATATYGTPWDDHSWDRHSGDRERFRNTIRAALEAALTRQPVAGDGDDAANWRRAKACMSAIGQSDKSVSYACALLLSENARKVNAGRAEITLRGITDGDEECGDWRITVEQLAAPAATPTDGGEG